MKIATYNLLKGGTRRVHWVKLLEHFDVDLLLVQESYAPHEHLSTDSYPDAARRSAWQAVGHGAWGSAIFSRTGVVKPINVPAFAGWVVGAEIHGAAWQRRHSKPCLAFSIHAPAGPGGYWQQMNHLLDEIKQIAGDHEVIVGGDFNIAVSPGAGTTWPAGKKDRAVQARLADEFGLLNCWQTAHPEQAPCQTLRWTGNRSTPYHCDGIFVPTSWRGRLEACEVLAGKEWNELSDHNPVVASFGDVRPPRKRNYRRVRPTSARPRASSTHS